MLNSICKYSIILLSLIMFLSCSSLKSKYYVGEKSKLSEFSDKLKIESIWLFEGKPFTVRIIDSTDVIVVTLDWNRQKEKYETKTSQAFLSTLYGKGFLNIKEENDDLYTIFRLIPSLDGTVVIFTINDDFIEKQILNDKIDATKIGNDYILNYDKSGLDNYIKENIENIFDYNISGIISPLDKLEE